MTDRLSEIRERAKDRAWLRGYVEADEDWFRDEEATQAEKDSDRSGALTETALDDIDYLLNLIETVTRERDGLNIMLERLDTVLREYGAPQSEEYVDAVSRLLRELTRERDEARERIDAVAADVVEVGRTNDRLRSALEEIAKEFRRPGQHGYGIYLKARQALQKGE